MEGKVVFHKEVEVYKYKDIEETTRNSPQWVIDAYDIGTLRVRGNVTIWHETLRPASIIARQLKYGDYIVNNDGHIEIWTEKDLEGYEPKTQD